MGTPDWSLVEHELKRGNDVLIKNSKEGPVMFSIAKKELQRIGK
jgi:hypothetical protein